ncbi:hypothetical protein M409DRAFT_19185 [Zasmidium cellare ATCC 36951]|uniref:Uncharacterized protein n=1 Tax=Zasmidium cellare ATCC 36951 TaxID=1080233 RepID=A0A6A6CTI3_ZASCE|nr:uncharacterized protein M409DRAFT_19185 [Zasmidium cellare ATCC 36951]KAF2170365.1 hypothetical protein M409DRAFT_19185 [Zasmidium cellare ATCC 36951]
MATRRLRPEDWNPAFQTRISTRVAHEPRDEFARISKNSDRALRPKPLNIPPRQLQSPPDLKAPPPSRKQSSEYGDVLRDPEIVDVAPSGTWPQRESPAHRQQRKQSPSITSQYSTRQSEISLGILDYYMRDRTPSLHSPTLPPPTPKVDPAIEKFDFGLPPTPTPSAATPELSAADTKPGAERRDQPLIPLSPPTINRPPPPPKGYSLFPVIKQVTPPPRQPILVEETINLQAITPTTHHPPPDPSYRQRKESISTTTAGRTRTDSHPKRTPLRIFSSDSTSSTATPRSRRQISTSSSTMQHARTSSPPSASRWSDDTIASPPSTAGLRTSFGSLLRRESTAQQGYSYYPDCFFEDDDDEAEPLRRRRWRRSPGATTSSGESASYGAGRRGQTPLWRRVLLCGCGG